MYICMSVCLSVCLSVFPTFCPPVFSAVRERPLFMAWVRVEEKLKWLGNKRFQPLLFIYNAVTIPWYGPHNRARLQIKCALGGGDSPQHGCLYWEKPRSQVGWKIFEIETYFIPVINSDCLIARYMERCEDRMRAELTSNMAPGRAKSFICRLCLPYAGWSSLLQYGFCWSFFRID